MSSRKAKQKADSRSLIFKAAEAAFVEGVGDFEMGDVAKRARVSVGLAYHYFGSKSGLIAALIADFYDRYDAVVNQHFARGLPWGEREYMRLMATVEFLFSDPLATVMLGRLSGSPDVIAAEAERRNAIVALAVVNISKGQERGDIPPDIDPEIAAAAINGGLREAMTMALRRQKRMSPQAFCDQVWGLVAGALRL